MTNKKAGYAILVNEWKGSRLSMALGFYELFTGLGMIAGPLLGSALFTAGGYPLPFYFVAALLGGAAILNGILLESSEPPTADYEIFHSPMPDESINGDEPDRSSEFHSSTRSQYSSNTYSDQGKVTSQHALFTIGVICKVYGHWLKVNGLFANNVFVLELYICES